MSVWSSAIMTAMRFVVNYAWIVMLIYISIALLIGNGKFNFAKFVLNTLFFVYICCAFALVFFPLPAANDLPYEYQIQMIPGFCIYDTAKHFSIGSVAQIVLNVVLTVPFGAYLRYYWKMDMWDVARLALALSFVFELGQLTGLFFVYDGSYRLCDIDDLICNTLGGVLGAYLTNKCTFLPAIEKYDWILIGYDKKNHNFI